MKVQNKKIIIGMITSLMLVSSMIALAPIISHYNDSYNKNSILGSTINNYSRTKLSSNSSRYSISTKILINNLTYINKYINSSLIVKEKLLRLSILGGTYDKTDKYKNDKKMKSSELAQFSHALKHVHRYGDQVRATIDNSTTSLDKESSVISQIIPLIENHPYTYSAYLNELKISIPNISFFINTNNLPNANNLNYKTSNISNNSFGIKVNNTNFNSIAFSSEEDGTNVETMYKAGSSIYAAAFTKISFQASIISFNKTSNSFEYAKPTSKIKKTSKIPPSSQLDTDNSEIINDDSFKNNSLSYFSSSRTDLSSLNSLNNTLTQDLPTPLVPNYLPDYFNKQIFNDVQAKVRYNQISSFKNNESIYIPAILFGPGLIAAIGNSIIIGLVHIPVGILTKKRQRLNKDYMNRRLSNIERQVSANNIDTKIDPVEFIKFIKETDESFILLNKDVLKAPLKRSDRARISEAIKVSRTRYDTNTATRRKAFGVPFELVDHPANSRSNYTGANNNRELDVNEVELLNTQQSNSDILQNAIDIHIEATDSINEEIEKFETADDLRNYENKIITPFQEAFIKLHDVNYFNENSVDSLETKLNDVIQDFTKRITNRISEIQTKRWLAEIRFQMEHNKREGQKRIDVIASEIDALEDSQSEKQLNSSGQSIKERIASIRQYINDKKYENGVLVNLRVQIDALDRAVLPKIDEIIKTKREGEKKNTKDKVLQNINDVIGDLRSDMNDSSLFEDGQALYNFLKKSEEKIVNIIMYIENHKSFIEDNINELKNTINTIKIQYKHMAETELAEIHSAQDDTTKKNVVDLESNRIRLKELEDGLKVENPPKGEELIQINKQIEDLKRATTILQEHITATEREYANIIKFNPSRFTDIIGLL